MSAREKQYVPSDGSHAVQRILSPSLYLGWRFAARTAVAEQLPVWALYTDLCRGSTLICPVVPLDEVTIHFAHPLESRQRAPSPGSLPRPRQPLLTTPPLPPLP